MPYEEFFQAIRPGLTLYGVLVTFAFLSITAAKFFWRYEKELRDENIEKLKDLMEGFRRSYIEPFLRKHLIEAREDAYNIAIKGLIADLYQKRRATSGEFENVLVEDITLKKLVDEPALKARLGQLKQEDSVIEKFLSSASGVEFFDKLDSQYEKKSTLFDHYKNSCRACGHASYAFFSLFLIFVVGILQVLGRWPDIVLYLWLFLLLLTLGCGIAAFLRLEIYRRSFLRLWEELQLYAKI